jgi:MFS family permease
MAALTTGSTGSLKSDSSPSIIVGQVAAALAVGMGIGRFVYTPILPLMVAEAHVTSQLGGLVATGNYVGYLAGAMGGIFLPQLLHSKVTLRISLVVVVLTLSGMPVTEQGAVWFVLRFIAGIASALVFMVAVSSMLRHLRAHGHQPRYQGRPASSAIDIAIMHPSTAVNQSRESQPRPYFHNPRRGSAPLSRLELR